MPHLEPRFVPIKNPLLKERDRRFGQRPPQEEPPVTPDQDVFGRFSDVLRRFRESEPVRFGTAVLSGLSQAGQEIGREPGGFGRFAGEAVAEAVASPLRRTFGARGGFAQPPPEPGLGERIGQFGQVAGQFLGQFGVQPGERAPRPGELPLEVLRGVAQYPLQRFLGIPTPQPETGVGRFGRAVGGLAAGFLPGATSPPFEPPINPETGEFDPLQAAGQLAFLQPAAGAVRIGGAPLRTLAGVGREAVGQRAGELAAEYRAAPEAGFAKLPKDKQKFYRFAYSFETGELPKVVEATDASPFTVEGFQLFATADRVKGQPVFWNVVEASSGGSVIRGLRTKAEAIATAKTNLQSIEGRERLQKAIDRHIGTYGAPIPRPEGGQQAAKPLPGQAPLAEAQRRAQAKVQALADRLAAAEAKDIADRQLLEQARAGTLAEADIASQIAREVATPEGRRNLRLARLTSELEDLSDQDLLGFTRRNLRKLQDPKQLDDFEVVRAELESRGLTGRARLPAARPAAPVPLAEAVPVAKEPWQMTQDAFVKQRIAGIDNTFYRQAQTKQALTAHRLAIEQALAEGKLMPAEVLAEYPDLARTARPAAPSLQAITQEAWEAGQTRPFVFDPNSTANQGRFRLVAPETIQKGSYFTRQSSTPGISYIMGKDTSGATITQAIRFDKARFSENKARQWWNANQGRFKFSDAQAITQEGELVPPSVQRPPVEAGAISPSSAPVWETGQTRPFAFDPNSTANQGRFRLQPPENYDPKSFRTRQSTTFGVSYIVGKRKDGQAGLVQAIRFDKAKFNEAQARAWWETNKQRFPFADMEAVSPPSTPTKPLAQATQQVIEQTPKPASAPAPGALIQSAKAPQAVAVSAPPTKPPLPKPPAPPKPGRPQQPVPPRFVMPDLPDVNVLADDVAFVNDMPRKIANTPGLRWIFSHINPAAVANDDVTKYLALRAHLRSDGFNFTSAVIANLKALARSQDELFGAVDEKGLLISGSLKGKALNDVRTYSSRYEMTVAQRDWIDTANDLEKAKLAFLKKAGIDIKELAFDEGGQYAGRRVFAKLDDNGELIETAFTYPGPGRPGRKAGFERERVFKTQDEAVKAGYRYLKEEDALSMNIQAAYNRVADKQAAEWLLRKLPHRPLVAGKPLTFGEGFVPAPAFMKAAFTGPEAQANALKVLWGIQPQYSGVLGALNKVNVLGRFMALSQDLSIAGIQLLLTMGRPQTYAQAFGGAVRQIINPKFHADYLARNADLLGRNPGLMVSLRGTEITQAAGPRGLVGQAISRLPPGARRLFETLPNAYAAAMDVAGVELMKSFEHLATTPLRRQQVVDFVNEFRGLASTPKLGTSGLWRQGESMAALAPQYNRAVVAMLLDTMRGGVRGQLARENLIRGLIAVHMVALGISIAGGEKPDEAIKKHLSPLKLSKGRWIRNPDYLLWQVGGTAMGFGSKTFSLMRMLIDSATEPDKLLEDSMENPALRFMRGNLSFLGGDSIDILTGRNFIGDPVRDNPLSFAREIVAPYFMPLWASGTLLESGTPEDKLRKAGADFVGGRAYPVSPMQKFIHYAEDKLKKPYDQMTRTERKRLQVEDAKGRGLWEAYQKDNALRGRTAEVLNVIEGYRSERINVLRQAVEQGIRGDKLREVIQNSGTAYGAALKGLDTIPLYKAQLDEIGRVPPQELPQDYAYRLYQEIISDPKLDDPIEGYNFDERDRRLAGLRLTLGADLWADVQEGLRLDRARMPALVQEYYRDIETIKPYWNVTEEVAGLLGAEGMAAWKQYTKANSAEKAQLRKGQPVKAILRLADRRKRGFLKQNPQIDALVIKWGYRATPLTEEGMEAREELLVPAGAR